MMDILFKQLIPDKMPMTLENKYPELFRFFGAYVYDADDDMPDERVVQEYKNDCMKSDLGHSHLLKACVELQDLMSNAEFYWKEVQESANRYFETLENALNWLKMVKSQLSAGYL